LHIKESHGLQAVSLLTVTTQNQDIKLIAGSDMLWVLMSRTKCKQRINDELS